MIFLDQYVWPFQISQLLNRPSRKDSFSFFWGSTSRKHHISVGGLWDFGSQDRIYGLSKLTWVLICDMPRGPMVFLRMFLFKWGPEFFSSFKGVSFVVV